MPWLGKWWDWIQIFIFLGLAPFFVFPNIEQAWIFMVIPMTWVIRWRIKNNLIERTVLDWGIFLLCIQLMITCFVVPDIGTSLSKISGLLYAIVLFYSMIVLLKQEKMIKIAVILFMVGSVIFTLLGFLGMHSVVSNQVKRLDILISLKEKLPSINFSLSGAEAGFNPNPLGGLLVLIIPLFIVFSIWFLKRRKAFLFILIILVLFEVCVLLFTLSRGSWLGLFVGSVVLISQFFKNRRIMLIFSVVLLLVLAGFYISLVGPENIQESGQELGDKLLNRYEFWAKGVKFIDVYPLRGIGMNRVRFNPGIGYNNSHLHNHMMHTAAEMGIPALIAYLAILIGAGFMVVEVWRKGKIEWMQMAILGLGCGQVAHFVFGIADSVPLGAKPGFIFWISLALITGIYNFHIKGGYENDIKQA